MTHSPLTNQIRLSPQNSSRGGATIDTFLIHHQAGTNDDATINAMVSGSKEVSANYTISNEGRITLVVDEDRRAWTSSSSHWDGRSITVEIENQSAGGDWPISDAALNAAAALLRDLRRRYNIVRVIGHRDLYTAAFGWASYPTFCPGPHTVAEIVRRADAGSTPAAPVKTPAQIEEEYFMSIKDDLIRDLTHIIDARVSQAEDRLRREARLRLYKDESNGQMIAADPKGTFVIGPWDSNADTGKAVVLRDKYRRVGDLPEQAYVLDHQSFLNFLGDSGIKE